MSQEVKKGKLFVKEVVARLKGDDAEAKASKIARKAVSAVDSQLAALRAKQVDCEVAVEDATDALAVAKFPTEQIKDSQGYIQRIKTAQSNLDSANQELTNVKESISYFESLLGTF